MPRAYGYIRVSTEEQANGGVSLDEQTARIEAYCRERGFELVEVIADPGVSGSVPLADRPNGNRLLPSKGGLLRKGDVVVTVKLDRLSRDVQDCLLVIQAWQVAGIKPVFLDFAHVDMGTAAGVAALQMGAVFAEWHRNTIRENTRRALQHKKARGEVYTRTPYGFDRSGDKLIPNEQEQRGLARVLELDQQGRTLSQIVQALTDEGYATKGGKPWQRGTVAYMLKTQKREPQP